MDDTRTKDPVARFKEKHPQYDYRRVTILAEDGEYTVSTSVTDDTFTGLERQAAEWLDALTNEFPDLITMAYQPDEVFLEVANLTLEERKVPGTLTELVERKATIWASKYRYELEGYTKVRTLTSIVNNPNVGRKEWGGSRKERPPYETELVLPEIRDRGYHHKRMLEVHPVETFELIEATKDSFLVRFNCFGGYLKRYKSFNQVLELDDNFQATGSKSQFYVAHAIMDGGYKNVELEYTIPGTKKRIDIAIWNDDRTRLLGFIEVDGVQHKKKVDYFDQDNEALKTREESDNFKNRFAAAIGVPIVRIHDDGGTFDKGEFKKAGLKALELMQLPIN